MEIYIKELLKLLIPGSGFHDKSCFSRGSRTYDRRCGNDNRVEAISVIVLYAGGFTAVMKSK